MLKREQFAIVFLFKNMQEVEYAYECANSKEQNESFGFCAARERGQEIISCFTNKVNFSILTKDQAFNGADLLLNKTILLRGIVPLVRGFKEKFPKLSYLVESSVVKWPKKLVAGYAKRSVYLMDFANTRKLGCTKPYFIKTVALTNNGDSGSKWSMIINNQSDFDEYLNTTMQLSDSFQMIVSDIMDIHSDALGKKEYRCWISNQVVSSISRYLDYNVDYEIPKEIVDFALDFTKAHKHLSSCYVLDLAETSKGVDIVELNDLECSSRYARNSFEKFIQFIIQ